MTPNDFREHFLNGCELSEGARILAHIHQTNALAMLAKLAHDHGHKVCGNRDDAARELLRDLLIFAAMIKPSTHEDWRHVDPPLTIEGAFFGVLAGRKDATLEIFAWFGFTQQELAPEAIALANIGDAT